MGKSRDYGSIGVRLKKGETADFYDQKPGVFGRIFQEPDESVVREGNTIKVYKKKPGAFGRTFQEPDEEIKIKK